jgi:hypothetical protein
VEFAMPTVPEPLDDADQSAAPLPPNTSVFGDIPRVIWVAYLSAWGSLFGLFILFFTTSGPATIAVLTASFFGLMTLGLPAALGALSRSPPPQFGRTIVTRNGPVSTGAAATQILMIPVSAVIGLTALIMFAM